MKAGGREGEKIQRTREQHQGEWQHVPGSEAIVPVQPCGCMGGNGRVCPQPGVLALRGDSRSILVNLNCLVTVHQLAVKTSVSIK